MKYPYLYNENNFSLKLTKTYARICWGRANQVLIVSERSSQEEKESPFLMALMCDSSDKVRREFNELKDRHKRKGIFVCKSIKPPDKVLVTALLIVDEILNPGYKFEEHLLPPLHSNLAQTYVKSTTDKEDQFVEFEASVPGVGWSTRWAVCRHHETKEQYEQTVMSHIKQSHYSSIYDTPGVFYPETIVLPTSRNLVVDGLRILDERVSETSSVQTKKMLLV